MINTKVAAIGKVISITGMDGLPGEGSESIFMAKKGGVDERVSGLGVVVSGVEEGLADF